MADPKIFIWPIGAEAPFVSSEPRDLRNFLNAQAQAWQSVIRDSPGGATFKNYVDANLQRIDFFDSFLRQLQSANSEQRANVVPALLAIARNHKEMWIDASSTVGQDLIFELRKNNSQRFAQIQAKAHADWEDRLRDWDAATAQSPVKDVKPQNPGAQALAKALLGKSPILDDTVANAETKIRSIIESAKFTMAEILNAKESANKDLQAAVDRARIDIEKMLGEAHASLRAVQAETFHKTSKMQLEQEQIASQIALKVVELSSRVAGLMASLDEKSKEIPKIEAELANLTTQVAEKIKGAAAAIAAHEEAHRQQLILRAPITYWLEKQDAHKRVYWSALASFVALNAAVLGLFWWQSESIWQHLKEVQGHSAGVLNVTGLVAFTLPSVAYFWILKHISRIFVDNMSNANDAGQRSVMLQTYLALVAEPTSKVSEQERLLALNALFRPSATSGSDDAPPSNLLEILTKAGEKKS